MLKWSKVIKRADGMHLEWPEHSKKLVEGVTRLHSESAFHDVTLSAEGKQIKAHRVILAAASTYFKVISIYNYIFSFFCGTDPKVAPKGQEALERVSIVAVICVMANT